MVCVQDQEGSEAMRRHFSAGEILGLFVLYRGALCEAWGEVGLKLARLRLTPVRMVRLPY